MATRHIKTLDNQRSGSETFTYMGKDTDMTVLEFWSWYFSDLLDIKAKVAEYIVTKALCFEEGINTGYWTAHNIVYMGKRIELRAASYMKSDIDSKVHDEYIRHIDIRVRDTDLYVFCLLPGKSKEEANPLIIDNWEFYIIPIWYIKSECADNKTITMSKVERMVKPTDYNDIKNVMDQNIRKMNDLELERAYKKLLETRDRILSKK